MTGSLTSQRPPLHISFATHKRDVVVRAREFVRGSKACVVRIAEVAGSFIEDATTVMVHGYSRPVTQALLSAATVGKKRFEVFVTESRPVRPTRPRRDQGAMQTLSRICYPSLVLGFRHTLY